MNNLIWIALLLIIIWVIATVTRVVVGALLHVLWVVALILLIVWVVRKFF
jgi:hypothetical protein